MNPYDPLGTSTRWLIVLVVTAACLPYLPTIDDYFLQDDFGVVQLLVQRPWTTFPRWFTMPWMEDIWAYTPDEIRPFVAFTYQLTGKFTPGRPELHHVFNIAMHAANAVLVMAVARAALGLSARAAAFGAIVFAVLPVQAESVAWITGRVDSMPTLFYLATFLAYVRWRRDGGRGRYAWSLALFVVALFSKQNTITMGATLAAYDLLVLDAARRRSLAACIAAWTPFAVLTTAFLLLRQALFGSAVRGGVASVEALEAFIAMAGRHLQHVTLGHTGAVKGWEIAAAVSIAIAIGAAAWHSATFRRLFVCFGVLWWVIGVAPSAVAGYESPRHVYLASIAWAFSLALLLEAGWQAAVHSRPARRLLIGAATAIVLLYVVRLVPVVQTWQTLAAIAESGGQRVIQEAREAPAGTLLLVRLPTKSWEWAAPFAIAPPFAEPGLTEKVRLVTPQALHCCGAAHWDAYTREQIRAWLKAPDQPPLVAVHVADGTGAVSRLTDADNPDLRAFAGVFLETDSPAALNRAITNLLQDVVRR
jgi:hypothetical protein